MNLLLVDTGPLVALASAGDLAHQRCTDFLKDYRGRLLTTWAVLTEFSHLAPGVAATLPLYQWIERGGLDILPLGRDELISAIDWIERYADRPMDLADAS
ncbi:MAG: VapC toxin family PIN domain ribonuclease, partial [Dechloromonas sp.]|nr:VapC toxin family PIN domain ribonuclease [Dechloromonas sp.]